MNKASKIVLLGYMGSGKSRIGKVLAGRMGYKFIDLDSYISKKEKQDIASIFEEKGEKYFRKKEKKYLKKLLKKEKDTVIALGGGTPIIKGVMKMINKRSISIYLKANTETLHNRLKPEVVERPLLSNLPEDFLKTYIDSHLESRKKEYEKAKIHIVADGIDADELVNAIIGKLNHYGTKVQ